MIVSCGDKTVRLWNLKNGKLLRKLQLPYLCRCFDLNSDETLLAVAHLKGVEIWDFSSLVKLTEIELKSVNDVRFNEPGTKLIVGQSDGHIFKIDLY